MILGGYQIVDCSDIDMTNMQSRVVLYTRLVDACKHNKPVLIRNLDGNTFFSNVRFIEDVDKYGDGYLESGVAFTYFSLDITTFNYKLVGIQSNGYMEEQTISSVEF